MSAPEHEPRTGLAGIHGQPFVDLEPLLDLSALPALHEEICEGLARVPTSYTGGSHRSLGVVPPELAREVHGDYGEVLRSLDREQRRRLVALADDPEDLDPEDYHPGEEQEHSLSRRQMLWLKLRHGVYFPWQVYLEMIPNHYWHQKSSGEGKAFTREARTFFPRTVEFVQRLPFRELGRCNVMGLDPFHHGTVHRDADPARQRDPPHFITFCPAGNKRLFLLDRVRGERHEIRSRAYWFNDADYHGVAPDPFFRYSVRVDGRFTEEFLVRLGLSAPPLA